MGGKDLVASIELWSKRGKTNTNLHTRHNQQPARKVGFIDHPFKKASQTFTYWQRSFIEACTVGVICGFTQYIRILETFQPTLPSPGSLKQNIELIPSEDVANLSFAWAQDSTFDDLLKLAPSLDHWWWRKWRWMLLAKARSRIGYRLLRNRRQYRPWMVGLKVWWTASSLQRAMCNDCATEYVRPSSQDITVAMIAEINMGSHIGERSFTRWIQCTTSGESSRLIQWACIC